MGGRGGASLGFTWTHLDSLGLTSTHQISLELTRSHQDSLEPHKTRTKYHPENGKREKGKGVGQLNFLQFPPHYQTARTHARPNRNDFPVELPPNLRYQCDPNKKCWISGYLDIWIFGYLDIWIFAYLDSGNEQVVVASPL